MPSSRVAAEVEENGAGWLMRRLVVAYLREEGATAIQSGRPARAAAYLRTALALEEGDADLWTLLGAACDDVALRSTCARRALALDPGHRPAQSLLATVPPPARGIRSRLPTHWQQLSHRAGDDGDLRQGTYTALVQAYAQSRPQPVAAPVGPALYSRLLAGLALLILLSLNLLLGNVYAQKYRATIYPGVRIGGLAVGGQDPAAASSLLRREVAPLLEQRVQLSAGARSWSFAASELGLRYRVDEAIIRAWNLGRNGSAVASWFERLSLALVGREVPLLAEIQTEPLQAAVEGVAAALDRPAVPPSVSWQDGGWAIVPGQDGRHVAREELRGRLVAALTELASGTRPAAAVGSGVTVPVVTDSVVLSPQDIADLQLRLARAGRPLTLRCAEQSWELRSADIAPWLQVEFSPPGVGINRPALSAYLESLSATVAREAVPPRLEVVDGRAVYFQFGQDGRRLDIAAALTAVEALLQRRLAGDETPDTLVLPVTVIPAGGEELMAELGVLELVGEGTSTFAGSPWERATNIRIGGQELHGRLIAPDEVFSLNDALNPITWEKGYQYSLIIGSGGVMYYGLGGGLCQVATTLYRAALYSGLEIVERTPHLWRIEYYEQDAQPGFDATIYAGGPDLKFRNNTGHYLLIQVETDLDAYRQTVRFYGTAPGWSVSIEDYWLSADGHAASYRRVVRKDGKVIDERTFYSYYQ